jgi:site-specific DNA recombinase
MTDPLLIRAGLYARVSGDQQVEDDTIASQLDVLERRTRHDGVIVPPELRFIDDGYSGDPQFCPALERLRNTADAGGLDRLYIECPDRLARVYAYQMVLVDELRRQAVEIIFVNAPLDDSPE